MKAYILYEEQDAFNNRFFIKDIVEAAKRKDVDLKLIFVDDLDIDSFLALLDNPLFVWNRTRSASIASRIQSAGIRIVNKPFVNDLANNKRKTIEFANSLGIPTVPILDEVRDFPVVIKTVDGHGGDEVALCQNAEQLSHYEKNWHDRATLLQPYIETYATDLRAWVVGDQIIGCVKRVGNDDFRSNYTRGGSIEKYSLSETQTQQILLLQKALQSDYIGIDFLLLPNGDWMLNEIEDPVGARSFYELFKDDLAEILVNYLVDSI
ncbi:hypothetical protein M3603_09420 [Rummeliibacillus stabekisii]|uniref:ATP-grasp domain-containing protein n=1 Tax=Rummeliibacillus stabekisii TaxID=241244 RepID=UPI00203A42AF|nr:hypothetical protein [Rummeliibacillus stabekisii]MCM3316884.1 hypothetical protein [Rummeliibacillus stabekisii]